MAVKLGPRGAAMLDHGSFLSLPPPQVDVVDTTGAGDAFNAGFLYCWLRGKPPAECLKLANLCGAYSTRKSGGIASFPIPSESQV